MKLELEVNVYAAARSDGVPTSFDGYARVKLDGEGKEGLDISESFLTKRLQRLPNSPDELGQAVYDIALQQGFGMRAHQTSSSGLIDSYEVKFNSNYRGRREQLLGKSWMIV